MRDKSFFQVPPPASETPRSIVSDAVLTALLCAAMVGLLIIGASVDEPVDSEIEALALAERAQLLAQGWQGPTAEARP